MGLVQGESMDRRFFHRLGASFLDRTICATAGGEGLVHTLGGKVGMKVEAFAESKLILIWGSNSIGSNLHFWRIAQQAKRHGAGWCASTRARAKPPKNATTTSQLLPGTDAALALALMHEFTAHGWLDHDYIARHTVGWEKWLRERALQWPPERAAQVCGLPVEQIRQLARDYGHHPARRHPSELRHAARARRRQRGARRGLPARAHGQPGGTARAACCCPARAASRFSARRCSGPTCWRRDWQAVRHAPST
jgi:anaerobic selenocysteine-containing dehydrogenase